MPLRQYSPGAAWYLGSCVQVGEAHHHLYQLVSSLAVYQNAYRFTGSRSLQAFLEVLTDCELSALSYKQIVNCQHCLTNRL
jgi:hypothetical protein